MGFYGKWGINYGLLDKWGSDYGLLGWWEINCGLLCRLGINCDLSGRWWTNYGLFTSLHYFAGWRQGVLLVGFSPDICPYPCKGGDERHGTALADDIATFI
jgi:hypothetical protein